MGWNHIVIEGYCFFNSRENKEKRIPNFCLNGPSEVGLHCIEGCGENNTRCPYFAFGKARSTVIVTDNNGTDFACSGFAVQDEINISESEYIQKEKGWINDWSKRINERKLLATVVLMKQSYTVWIEAEEKENDWDIYDANTDVIVEFEDRSRWVASFFAYKNVMSLTEKNKQMRENLEGKYFWCSDMIFVDEVSRERIEDVIKDLIVNEKFQRVFCYCEPFDLEKDN